jgi:hypothetical protein
LHPFVISCPNSNGTKYNNPYFKLIRGPLLLLRAS